MIISKQEAKEQGLKHYFTGKPCKKGHIAERQVSNRGCCECKKEIYKNWYLNNTEQAKQNTIKWQKNNPEKLRKIWREAGKRKPWKVTATKAKRRSAKLQRTPNWLSEDDLFLIKEVYSLANLRKKATGIDWHVDHIVPLQGKNVSGLHCIENLQVIPASLNLSKNNSWDWENQRGA